MIRDLILKYFPELTIDDVRSTSMGAGGEDVTFSAAARAMLPIQIECKNKEKYAVYKDYDQAVTHGRYDPVLFIKQNNSQPLAVVGAEYLLDLLRRDYESRKGIGAA